MSNSVKQTVQTLLKRIGLYQRVKSSFLYDLYWKVADPRLIRDRDEEVEFFRRALGGFRPGDLIFDVGANMGQKTDVFLRLGAHVVAVDPDRSNQEILRQRFLTWRLNSKPVVIAGQAVSNRTGTETMWVDAPGSAKNTLNSKWVDTLRVGGARFGETLDFGEQIDVPTLTLDDLIQSHGRPFYIKIDVEGHEVSVIEGLHSAVPFLSFEVNLPEFLPEAVQCVELVDRLAPGGGFNFTADCRCGMALDHWTPKQEFLSALNACHDPCIEVFWKAPL